jgi:hypothetical protein
MLQDSRLITATLLRRNNDSLPADGYSGNVSFGPIPHLLIHLIDKSSPACYFFSAIATEHHCRNYSDAFEHSSTVRRYTWLRKSHRRMKRHIRSSAPSSAAAAFIQRLNASSIVIIFVILAGQLSRKLFFS